MRELLITLLILVCCFITVYTYRTGIKMLTLIKNAETEIKITLIVSLVVWCFLYGFAMFYYGHLIHDLFTNIPV